MFDLGDKLSDEFLDTLVFVARTFGWIHDYSEIENFIRSCFAEAGKDSPSPEDLEPFPYEDNEEIQ